MLTSEFGSTEKKMYSLMYMDTEVIRFSDSMSDIAVINEKYMPFSLARDVLDGISLYTWISRRATPLTRKNVEFLYAMCGVPRDVAGQVAAVTTLGGASINDNYWFKEVASEKRFEDVESDKLLAASDRTFGLMTLTGSRKSAKPAQEFSPEITLQGNWSKCLVMENDRLLMYKADDKEFEQEASEFALSIGLDVILYWQEEYEDVDCSVCEIASNRDNQWFSAREFGEVKLKAMYPKEYAQMMTFDYIVGNSDRHNLNWSVVMDSELNPKGFSPLYDFNFAYMPDTMKVPKEIDYALIETVEDFLSDKPNYPNRAFYLGRIKDLK